MSEAPVRELLTAEQLSIILQDKIAELAPKWLAQKPFLRESIERALANDQGYLLTTTMSFEEFLIWADGANVEWIEGKVLLMSYPSIRHQAIVVFLVTLLNLYVSTRNLGMVFTAPCQMRLHEPSRGRQPDVFFVEQANLNRFTKRYLDGPADLVVEVISQESGVRDRGEKFFEYETAGVQEYWLIDPQREQVEFYQLNDEGRYRLILGGRTGQYASHVIPGLTIEAEWFWQEPLPPVWMNLQS